MKYTNIRDEYEKRQSAIFAECGVFFAFSDKQFEENKTPLEEGDKYVRWIGGGYLPKSKAKQLVDSLHALSDWQRQAVKQTKTEDTILYHLNNHECFYTGDISDAVDVCESLGYTRDQVQAVYNASRGKAGVC